MDTKEIEVIKAKLTKKGRVEATYFDAEGNEITIKGLHKSHQDLRDAFAALVPFFADLTEQKEADYIVWGDDEANAELLRKLDVTGFRIGGDGDNRSVSLTGYRTLFTKQAININSGGVEIDSEQFEWEHIDEFDIALQNAIYEVKEYILKGKREELQPTLFDGNPDDPFAEPTPTDDVPPLDSDDVA